MVRSAGIEYEIQKPGSQKIWNSPSQWIRAVVCCRKFKMTMKKQRDFNDELRKTIVSNKLFPVLFFTYVYDPRKQLGLSEKIKHQALVNPLYMTVPLWSEEKERLQRILRVWEENKNEWLETATPLRLASEPKYVDCMAGIVTIMEMCKWLLGACWDGDRSKPPIPFHLYKLRMSELKEKNHSIMKRLQEFTSYEQSLSNPDDDIEILEVSSSVPKRRRVEEDREKSPQWNSTFMEKITHYLTTLSKAASAGENVSEALATIANLQHMKNDKNQEETSADLRKLEEMVSALERKTHDRNKEMIGAEREEHTPSPTVEPITSKKTTQSQNNTPTTVRAKNSSTSSSLSKTGEKSEKKTSGSAEKKVDVSSTDDDPNDDLISRVKRSQRNRRPARSFTPGWSPPGSPVASKPTSATKSIRVTQSVSRPVLPSRSQPAAPVSPDSGRPSSNESSDNVTVPVTEVRSQPNAQRPQENGQRLQQSASASEVYSRKVRILVKSYIGCRFQKPSPVPAPNRNIGEQMLSYSVRSPPVNVWPTTPNVPSHPANHNCVRSPQIPPFNLTEQNISAMWKEKIQLCDVRITLLHMFNADGSPHYYFLPLLLETIEKAIIALDNKDMIAFLMHKAAIEVGCNELGNVMRSCNPLGECFFIQSHFSTRGRQFGFGYPVSDSLY
ncbi:hypothetical protein COOONC_03056 [Cooperia oncophora]